jgi:hypothetical protein
MEHLQILDRSDGRVRVLVDGSVRLDDLLAQAGRAGEIRRFSFEPPKLSELFMEAIGSVPDEASTATPRR